MLRKMKFSIRWLLFATLGAAFLLQGGLMVKDITSLESLLEHHKSHAERLDARARARLQETDVCEAVVEDYKLTSEVYLAAKRRFKRLQLQRADE